jgi:hypothetical protein
MLIQHGLLMLFLRMMTGISFSHINDTPIHLLILCYSLRCVQVIAGVLGRAGEAGRKHRLALAAQKTYNFTPAANLQTPGHLKNTKSRYPSVIKLGGTIQELEEQDRGIVYDYRLDDDGQGERLEGNEDREADRDEVEQIETEFEDEDEDGGRNEGFKFRGGEEGSQRGNEADNNHQLIQGEQASETTAQNVKEGK